MAIGTLTAAERATLDRNLLAFYGARERLQQQLEDIIVKWQAAFDAMNTAWQHSGMGERARGRIETLRETVRVLEEDALLPIAEFDLSPDDERLDAGA